MNAQILCIGGSAARWQKWGADLEADGYVVVHAPDETEGVELLKAAPVAVVCIDSCMVAGAEWCSPLGSRLKNAHPRVPVVVIQAGSEAPPHFWNVWT